MSSSTVGSSFLGGLRSPNYFNGRLLSAEDLRAEQDGVLTRQHWLGRAIGHGVVDGLTVTAGAGSVTVAPGLGVSRRGTAIQVPTAVTLAVAPAAGGRPPAPGGRFSDCEQPPEGGTAPMSAGAYLLTVTAASRFEGLAPSQAAAGSTLPPACAARWEVQGLQFKTIRLDFPAAGSGVTAANRRNLLAHWCFGSMALARLAESPFQFRPDFTGLDTIGAPDLTPCDLPLAVFWWTGTAIDFVDNWSARRRVSRPDPDAAWAGRLSDTRVAISQARFLQFQERVDELTAMGAAVSTVAATVFGLLPPVGFLPLKPDSLVARLDAVAGGGTITSPTRPPRPVLFPPVATTPEATGTVMLARASDQQATIAPEMLELGDTFTNLFDQVQDLRDTVEQLVAHPETGPPPPSESRAERQAMRDRAWMAEVQGLRAGLVAGGGARGFDLATFFGSLPRRIGVIDSETVDLTLQRSWFDEAVNLAADPEIQVLVVRDSLGKRGVQPYVMFTKAIDPTTWLPLVARRG